LLFDELHRRGVPQLFVSCGEGRGSPRPFYDRLGFEPTGSLVGHDETELVIPIGG
jgi:hypothetical protein